MSFRIRRARRSDLAAVSQLTDADRPLLSAAEWKRLPSFLVDGLESGRIQLCVVEDFRSGKVRFLGGSAFLQDGVRDDILAQPTRSALSLVLERQQTRGTALLNRRQIAESNRRGALTLLNFFGTTHGLVADGASLNAGASIATETWTFFHAGFSFREILIETADRTQAEILRSIPAQVLRHRADPSGRPAWLFHITREDALRNPAGWPFGIMVATPPRFAFTAPQQEVLELALLDFSDREMMRELGLTGDSLKKRWRAIYRRAAVVEPAMFTRSTGADLRRALLQRVRHSLSELRPYR